MEASLAPAVGKERPVRVRFPGILLSLLGRGIKSVFLRRRRPNANDRRGAAAPMASLTFAEPVARQIVPHEPRTCTQNAEFPLVIRPHDSQQRYVQHERGQHIYGGQKSATAVLGGHVFVFGAPDSERHRMHEHCHSNYHAAGSAENAHVVQTLVTAGRRSMMALKLYDFAVYVDPHQYQRAKELHHPPPWPQPASLSSSAAAAATAPEAPLLHCPSLPASIVLRAARSLPTSLVQQEMGRALERKYCKVGGRAGDRELSDFLAALAPDRLPREAQEGDNIKEGSTITFSRSAGGLLTASAGGHVLARVHSPLLCRALLEMYVGEAAVNKRAKAAAAATLRSLATHPNARYTPLDGQQLECSTDVHGAEVCVLQLN